MLINNISPWANDVLIALKNLGGNAKTSLIAEEVKRLQSKQGNTVDWKSSVRNVLNDYCEQK
ncbi:MAG TPA: hypothetical protein VFF33_13440 [Ignavibacteriaceae bacterium]|nr:hypothetical protein [Ignavibacteriaceae bacterium]